MAHKIGTYVLLLSFFIFLALSGCLLFETELLNVEVVMKPGYFQYYSFGNNDSNTLLNLRYEIESSAPIDVYVVPSEEDFSKISSGQEFYHFPSCRSMQVLRNNRECTVPSGSAIVLSNTGNNDAVVKLKVYAR